MATSSAVAALVVRDTVGGTFNDNMMEGCALRIIPFTYEKVAGNTDADQIQIARVRSNWIIYRIELANDALSGCTAVDIGLWTDAAPGTATVVDDDVYATNYDPNAGVLLTTYTNLAFEARDIANNCKRVWEDAAATSDTNRWYRIALDLDTGGTATGTISGYVWCLVPAS